MKKTTYVEHESEQAQQLLTQTMMGLGMIALVHFKFGVKQPLFLQSVMAPVNLYENGVFKKMILGSKDRVWGEKLPGEQGATETVEGDAAAAATTTALPETKEDDSIDAKILSTWDAGKSANVDKLVSSMTKENINHQTGEGQWTALMVVSGLKNGTEKHVKALIALGADITLTDEDGCNALHWAAFHNRPPCAQALLNGKDSEAIQSIMKQKSGEDATPIEVAQENNNDEIIKLLQKAVEYDVDE